MTELIKNYLATAKLIKSRIDELSCLIKTETDLEKHKALKARKELLMSERYDMLCIATKMLQYDDMKKVSGDY